MNVSIRVPWDDRAARTVPVESMREGKVREFLHAVRSGLLNEPDGREIFRRMGLVTQINDHEVPRNIGLLFFSNDPTEWFRGAKIEVVQFAADRAGDVQEERTFGGSLLDQVRDCLAHLENLSVFHLQKQRNDIRAKTWVAYPKAALRDAAHLRAIGKRQDAYHRLQTALAENRNSPDAPAMLHEMAAIRASRDGNSHDESTPPLAWGVDGCPAGWFYIALDATGEWCYGVAKSLREIVDKADCRDRVFVDIPIGLPDKRKPKPRKCDLEARRLLNHDLSGELLPNSERRGTSVFPAPTRKTLYAKNYQDACCINERITGKKISRQTFAIRNKIRDADELLLSDTEASDKARRIVREVHPELCFWALNDHRPMQRSKSKKEEKWEANQDRLKVLEICRLKPRAMAEEICKRYFRSKKFFKSEVISRDDIADAMVASVTARANQLNYLPAEPQCDSEKLSMQMIWAVREAIRFENC